MQLEEGEKENATSVSDISASSGFSAWSRATGPAPRNQRILGVYALASQYRSGSFFRLVFGVAYCMMLGHLVIFPYERPSIPCS